MKGFFQEIHQQVKDTATVKLLIGIWNDLDDTDVEEENAVKTLMGHYGYTLTRNVEDGSWIWDPDVEVDA